MKAIKFGQTESDLADMHSITIDSLNCLPYKNTMLNEMPIEVIHAAMPGVRKLNRNP